LKVKKNIKSNTNNSKVFIIIPTFNEEGRIKGVLNKVLKYYQNVIVVDDFSTDNTVNDIKSCKGVKLIELKENRGAGYATKIGCDWAFNEEKADIVVTIDGDGQHAPEDIYLVLDKIEEVQLDIVFGYRPRKKNMPFIKKVGNYTLSKLSNLLFKVKLTDTLTGFHAFTKKAYPKIKWESDRYEFVTELIYKVYKSELKYGEVAVQTIYNDKIGGMEIKDGLNSIILMFYWRFLKN